MRVDFMDEAHAMFALPPDERPPLGYDVARVFLPSGFAQLYYVHHSARVEWEPSELRQFLIDSTTEP